MKDEKETKNKEDDKDEEEGKKEASESDNSGTKAYKRTEDVRMLSKTIIKK